MLNEYLNQPYPFLVNKWKLIVSISTFVAVFILVFQPLGLAEYRSAYKTLVIVGYGGVTFLALTVNLFIVPLLFKAWFVEKKWTVSKQILWQTWIIFTIGLGNYFYTAFIFEWFWGLKGFLAFQFITLAVGIIPIVVLTVVNQNMKLAQNLKSANDFNIQIKAKSEDSDPEQVVTIVADNAIDKIETALSKLLYIESIGNYVQVHYVSHGKIKNKLLRSTLKRIEMQQKDCKSLIKCHRAFLVNMNQIDRVSGNAQGLRLALKHTDFEIPVSRNYSKELKNKIARI